MKRLLCAIQVAMFLLCSAMAQPSFIKYYSSVGVARVNLNELSNGNILSGLAFQSGTSLMDPLGNVLHTQCYTIDTFLAVASVKRYSDNEFAFVGVYSKDTCASSPTHPMSYPVVGRMDSLGHTHDVHYYRLNASPCNNSGADLEITSANDVIAWGGYFVFFALRVDPSGSVQWARRFNLGNHGSFRFIKELPGGDLLAGMNMDTAGVVVARMNADGEFLWCKSYIRPRGMVADCLIESDDSFVITGYTDSTASTDFITPLPPEYHPKLFMMKLNGAGEMQWCKGYDSDPYRWYTRSGGARIVKAGDGNYVVLGNLGVEGYNFPYRPFLMKTDQNGDTLWTRSAGRLNHAYDIYDLLACSDGGVMYSVQGYGLGMGIFKTDSLGYLPCHNRWHQVEVSDLFPTDSSFTLSSIDGATAFPAFVTDTVYDPLYVTDACSTSTGMPPSRRGGLRVRPNPNAGHFTVEFDDPLMADSYYSVYDTMGKLLYQRPLPTGATLEEVDLSRYGAGTYVIKFTDRDGVCYERVVVE